MDYEKFFGLLRENRVKAQKNPTGLMSIVYWPGLFMQTKKSMLPPKPFSPGEISEKTETMMGLYRMAKEETKKDDGPAIDIGKATLSMIDQIKVTHHLNSQKNMISARVLKLTDSGWLEEKLQADQSNPSTILFLGMELSAEGKADSEAWELLGNMCKAMRPKWQQFLAVIHQDDIAQTLSAIYISKPGILVGLGSKINSLLLEKPIRLNDCHGKFYDLAIKQSSIEQTYGLVPLFHPEYLSGNPKMKRVAWEDMQKIMGMNQV